MNESINRRRFVSGVIASGSVLVAGCLGGTGRERARNNDFNEDIDTNQVIGLGNEFNPKEQIARDNWQAWAQENADAYLNTYHPDTISPDQEGNNWADDLGNANAAEIHLYSVREVGTTQDGYPIVQLEYHWRNDEFDEDEWQYVVDAYEVREYGTNQWGIWQKLHVSSERVEPRQQPEE